jgi:hypothetical protein
MRRHHAEQGVAMQANPETAFEVIEAQFLPQLLMGLLADPSRLDGPDKLSPKLDG